MTCQRWCAGREEDHVVAFFPLDDAAGEPILSGAIGGVLNANGNLVIGLAEQNGSGYAGIAYVEPDPDDPAQTLVSLLIAEGLAEETDGSAPTAEEEGRARRRDDPRARR